MDAVKRIEETWGGVYKGENGAATPSVKEVEDVKDVISKESSSSDVGQGSGQDSLEDLGLSTRTKNILLQAGIAEVTDLINLSKTELMAIQSFGEKSYQEVCKQLETVNLLPSDWD
ncbi:hypothetical protein OAJ44_03065 [Chloroflexi bacterium]|nr:hypothetical protein [Chloroflexota bacterium]